MSEARERSLHGGWIKAIGGQDRTRFRGVARAGLACTLAAAAYYLIRLPKLLQAA